MEYNVTDTALVRLMRTKPRRRLPKRQVVNALGDHTQLHLLVSGYVKRYLITKEGSKSTQVIYGPNDVFPMTPVFKAIYGMNLYRGIEEYYYEAKTDIVVHSISLTELLEALDKDPLLYKDLLFAAGVRFNTYISRLEDVSLRSSYWRIAHLLVFLADQFGEETSEGVLIKMPLQRQSIADILALTRETVTREMVKLEQKKLIKGQKSIVILDLEQLKAIYE